MDLYDPIHLTYEDGRTYNRIRKDTAPLSRDRRWKFVAYAYSWAKADEDVIFDISCPLPTGKRILVCGGRKFTGKVFLWNLLDALLCVNQTEMVISGGAYGADTLAKEWAKARCVDHKEERAEWDKYGGDAGPRRNTRMLREWNPDLVIAMPGGRGTLDMRTKARRAGVSLLEFL